MSPHPRITTQTLAVIATLLAAPDSELYGLDLAKTSGLRPGTIYPILDRLLKAGWLERRWEDIDPVAAGRPRRRLYRLTAEGAPIARHTLEQHLASLLPAASRTMGSASTPQLA
jgi:DNA-binding PadR family transcriptional regulator